MFNEGYIESYIIGEGIRKSEDATFEISFSDIETAFFLDEGSIRDYGTESIKEGLLNAKPFVADCVDDKEKEIIKVYFKPEICLNMNRDPRLIKERNDMSLKEINELRKESFELVEEQTYGHYPNFRGLLLGGSHEAFEELVFVVTYETPSKERLEFCYLIENRSSAINNFNNSDIENREPDFVLVSGQKKYDKEALFSGKEIKIGDTVFASDSQKGVVTFVWDFETENPRYEIEFGQNEVRICEYSEAVLQKETPKLRMPETKNLNL